MVFQLHNKFYDNLANDPGAIGVKEEEVKAAEKNPGQQMLKNNNKLADAEKTNKLAKN